MWHYLFVAVLASAGLAASGCLCTPHDLFQCPDISESPIDEALQPIDLESSAGELWFRFEDQCSRSACTYLINLHNVYAECIGKAQPFSAQVPAVDPGEYVITVPCETLTSLNLDYASWSVSLLGANGAALGHSQTVPITIQALEQIRADCAR